MKSKFVKAVAGVSLSALVATSCVTSAFAKDNSSTIYDSGTGYIAEKITHPEKGVMTTDGIVDYIGNGKLATNLENGNGDRGQNYSWGFNWLWGLYVYWNLLWCMDINSSAYETKSWKRF